MFLLGLIVLTLLNCWVTFVVELNVTYIIVTNVVCSPDVGLIVFGCELLSLEVLLLWLRV